MVVEVSARQQLLVDLINTLHVPDGDDVLDAHRAAGWLDHHSGAARAPGRRDEEPARAVATSPANGPLPQRELNDLRSLREGLRQLARANNRQDPDQSVLDDAAQTLAANPLTLRLGTAALTPGLDATAQGPGAPLLAAAAAAYLEENAAGTWGRIKVCASPTCQYAFVDTSRNASRRWCDMSGCGNQAKQRSYRQRRSTPTS